MLSQELLLELRCALGRAHRAVDQRRVLALFCFVLRSFLLPQDLLFETRSAPTTCGPYYLRDVVHTLTNVLDRCAPPLHDLASSMLLVIVERAHATATRDAKFASELSKLLPTIVASAIRVMSPAHAVMGTGAAGEADPQQGTSGTVTNVRRILRMLVEQDGGPLAAAVAELPPLPASCVSEEARTRQADAKGGHSLSDVMTAVVSAPTHAKDTGFLQMRLEHLLQVLRTSTVSGVQA